jgi:hypothetical protein
MGRLTKKVAAVTATAASSRPTRPEPQAAQLSPLRKGSPLASVEPMG